MATSASNTEYGPTRAAQVRAMLWVSLVIAVLAVAACLFVLPQTVGSVAGIPALAALTTAIVALRRMRGPRSSRSWAVATGVGLVLFAIVASSHAIGFVASIAGVLMLLLALAREPQQ